MSAVKFAVVAIDHVGSKISIWIWKGCPDASGAAVVVRQRPKLIEVIIGVVAVNVGRK